MKARQAAAAQIKKALVVMPEFSTESLKREITRLQNRVGHLNHKNEMLQSACDFYMDKSDTLEAMLVNNNIMEKTNV